MSEKAPKHPGDDRRVSEPALSPLREPHELGPDPDALHASPEMAVAEGDVRSAEAGEFIRGTSLWRDAWRRLLKNKLAVFGLIIVAIITIASIAGPTIIKRTLGFTPDYIPTDDVKLIK